MHSAISARRQIVVRAERVSASLDELMVRSEFIVARLANQQLMYECHPMSGRGAKSIRCESSLQADRIHRNPLPAID
jgi:hypothetical protein